MDIQFLIRLQELGAKRVAERKDVDAEDEEVIHQWFDAVIMELDAMDIEPRFDYLQISDSDDFDASVPSREKPFWAQLTASLRLIITHPANTPLPPSQGRRA